MMDTRVGIDWGIEVPMGPRSKGKDSMTKERWARIKRLPANTESMFHVSRKPTGNKLRPYFGVTYNVGRNKAKRESRAA